jgi:hypothetical protein
MPSAASRQPRVRRGKAVEPAKQTTASITVFTRVSKVQTAAKDVSQKVSAHEAPRTSGIEVVLSRKRKADNVLDSQEISAAATVSKKSRQDVIKVLAPRPISHLKRRKAPADEDKENAIPVKANTLEKFLLPPSTIALSSTSKPTQKRRRSSDANSEPAALLERLNIQSPARKRTRVKPSQTREILEQLPQELLDLLSLHTALLKSLTLQYAHNGPNVPVDIRSICPGVAQSWGKRKVTSEDIQRCVGVLGWACNNQTSTSPFILCDYGRGKLCIELTLEASSAHFDEERLNKTFESNLRSLWSLRKDSDPRAFTSSLPQATMTQRASAVPLLVKGRNAMDSLKADLAKRQAEKEARAEALPILNADGTKMSLLDRIKHKELALSQSAAPPSPAELQRRAALQRAEDVAGVIGMLTTATAQGRARISFTMPQLLVKLKDSLRTPVSQEDGAACVRLLAAEVAPEWLRIVTIGGKENVVIQCAMQPSKALVGQRVAVLLK